jgi:hypothetical protein
MFVPFEDLSDACLDVVGFGEAPSLRGLQGQSSAHAGPWCECRFYMRSRLRRSYALLSRVRTLVQQERAVWALGAGPSGPTISQPWPLMVPGQAESVGREHN